MKRILSVLLSLLMMTTAVLAEESAFQYEFWGDGVEITACIGEAPKELVIPGELGGLPVRSIGDYALAYQSMERVILPDSLENIGACAFNACYHLESIEFPSNLRIIGADAFLCCQSLTELYLPRNLEKIEDEAFYNCLNLQRVSLCADTTLGSRVFESCFSLTYVDRYLK